LTEERGWNVRAVVDLVGMVGVLLGLVFVGLELRSNTQAVRAETFQSLTDVSNDYIMQMAADPELSRIYHAATAGGLRALTPPDSARYWSLQRAYWVRMQNVYSQHTRGTLEDEDFFLYRAVICSADPGTRDLWPEHRVILTPGFREFVEGCWGAGGAVR